MLPGLIYINEKLIELKSSEETEILLLLEKLISSQKLGHPQGLAAIRAEESILFFQSENAKEVHQIVAEQLRNVNGPETAS